MAQAVSNADELPFMSVSLGVLFPGRINLYLWEVARALSITTEQVGKLIEVGKLKAIDIGSSSRGRVRKGKHCGAVRRFWRVPVSAFEQYVKENRSDNLEL